MWGAHEINVDTTMATYEKEMPDKTIRNLKDVLATYRYHMEPRVRTALADQRNPVGNMFAKVEQELAGMSYTRSQRKAGATLTTAYTPYDPIDLQSKWNAWTHNRMEKARKKPAST